MTEALAQAPDTDVLVGFNPEICAPQLLAAARDLRWIESLAAGVENCLAVPGLRERGLLLTNMRAVDAAVIAEHAIALTLALAHGLDVFAVDTANAQWSVAHGATTPMQSLEGKTLLVVGLGGIGTEVARRAHALGMTVVATRDGDRKGPAFVSHIGTPDELSALAKRADVIVSCVPLTPVTQGMFDAKFFALLKPTAIFINISRGGTMVMADLTAGADRQAPCRRRPGCRGSGAAARRTIRCGMRRMCSSHRIFPRARICPAKAAGSWPARTCAAMRSARTCSM